MRRGGPSIASNPVLIGAATLLVVVVGVFLAYNANQGLPFVPTYDLRLEVPSAAALTAGNDVRVGGARVGAVDAITARRRRDGSSYAVLAVKLDLDQQRLPVDSTVLIRPKSALGLKYVELTRGDSPRGYVNGATVPLSRARVAPVEIDDVFNIFRRPTREAIQTNLVGFGDALTGRGPGLNTAIGDLRPLVDSLTPVARTLAAPSTDLSGLISGLGALTREIAPVAEQQASLFRGLDTTFTALASVARPFLQESISEAPPTLDVAVRSFRRQRPFLRNTTALFAELRPGARALRDASPELAGALRIGTPTLRRSVALNRRLRPLLRTVGRFATDPQVPRGLRRLTETSRTLGPTLRFVAPAQTVCNYGGIFLSNAASLLSAQVTTGTAQKFAIIATPEGPNSEGHASSKPANGPTDENRLRSNPYPHTAAPGQPRECEAGRETFNPKRRQIGNIPGNQGIETENQRRLPRRGR